MPGRNRRNKRRSFLGQKPPLIGPSHGHAAGPAFGPPAFETVDNELMNPNGNYESVSLNPHINRNKPRSLLGQKPPLIGPSHGHAAGPAFGPPALETADNELMNPNGNYGTVSLNPHINRNKPRSLLGQKPPLIGPSHGHAAGPAFGPPALETADNELMNPNGNYGTVSLNPHINRNKPRSLLGQKPPLIGPSHGHAAGPAFGPPALETADNELMNPNGNYGTVSLNPHINRNKPRSLLGQKPPLIGPSHGHAAGPAFGPPALETADNELMNPNGNYEIVSLNPPIDLRGYQSRMIRESLRQNTIVILPSGAGKTLIAAEVILRVGSPALVVVPTIRLVSQHENTLRDVTGLNVRPYFGGAVFPTHFDVLVSTPRAFEIVQSHTSKNRKLQWRNFRTVVFDEVHHACKDHPYRKLALDLRSSEARPRVLGLTSSFAYNMHEEKVATTLKSICYDLKIQKVLTGTDDELREFDEAAWNAGGSIPEVHIKKKVPKGLLPLQARKPHKMLERFFKRVLKGKATPFADRLGRCVLRMESAISGIDPTFVPPIRTASYLKQWSVTAHRHANIPDQKSEIVDLYTQLEYWYEALRMLVVSWEEDAYASILMLKMMKCDLPKAWSAWPVDVNQHIAEFWMHEPQQFEVLQQLKEALLTKKGEIRRFRGLLFVQQRLSTHLLEYFIRNDRSLSTAFTPACLYATSAPATPSLCISKMQGKQNVQKFTRGRVNLLISTVVAEDSMPIPAANCIIYFDTTKKPNVSYPSDRFTRSAENVKTEVKEESEILRMVGANPQEEKLCPGGEIGLPPTMIPFHELDHWVDLNDLEVQKDVNDRDGIHDSQKQESLEFEASKFLQYAAHRGNCEAMLYYFCDATKVKVGISIENIDKGVYLQMVYGSCLRTITVESQEADNLTAYNTAALDMVNILRHQLVSRFGLQADD